MRSDCCQLGVFRLSSFESTLEFTLFLHAFAPMSTEKYRPPRHNGANKPKKDKPPKNNENPKKQDDISEDNRRQARAQRFASSNHIPRPYGHVSRGEDTRLQESDKERKKFFEEILLSFEDKVPMDKTLKSLRILREALLFRKPEEFSKTVFLFSARIASTVGQYQTYVPACQYLLNECGDILTEQERKELATLMVLHTSHCNNQSSQAFEMFFKYLGDTNLHIFQIISAWTVGDYLTWTTYYNSETDQLVYGVMSLGINRVLEHLASCLNASFFSYSLLELEKILPKNTSVEDFVKDNTTWEMSDNLVIRKRG